MFNNTLFIVLALVTRARGEITNEERARLAQVTEDIVAVVEEREAAGTLPFDGDAAADATALALVAIEWHESGFHADVSDCSRCKLGGIWCDGGRAISGFQMQSNAWQGHSRKEICRDHKLAAKLALDALSRPKASADGLFRGYASGNSALHTRAGKELYAGFMSLAGKRKMTVHHKGAKTVVSW